MFLHSSDRPDGMGDGSGILHALAITDWSSP